ncbi:MAG: M56 family metallopeptidase [Chloroflexi bacterium]|nr:MAG: M56 family metallopeptidase [Chloroflexota bacterium]
MARADRAFGILLGVAFASSAILVALLLTLVPRVEQLIARGPEDTADVVAALVLILASCGISLGLATLFRQLAATAMLIRRLVSQKVAEPRSVAFAASGLELDGKIDVVADSRPFSFCYWFLRPRICLSTALVDRLDIDELRAVLLHERYHLRQRDPLRLVIARYFAAGLYVVPVVDELVGFFTLQKEIAADQAAVRANGVEALASALDKLLPDADDVSLGLLVPVSSLSVTEARIDQLVAGRQVSLALSPLSVALSGGALLAAAVLVAIQGGASMAFEALPPLFAVPGLLVGPASLLFAAAVDGGLHQLRPLTQRTLARP